MIASQLIGAYKAKDETLTECSGGGEFFKFHVTDTITGKIPDTILT